MQRPAEGWNAAHPASRPTPALSTQDGTALMNVPCVLHTLIPCSCSSCRLPREGWRDEVLLAERPAGQAHSGTEQRAHQARDRLRPHCLLHGRRVGSRLPCTQVRHKADAHGRQQKTARVASRVSLPISRHTHRHTAPVPLSSIRPPVPPEMRGIGRAPVSDCPLLPYTVYSLPCPCVCGPVPALAQCGRLLRRGAYALRHIWLPDQHLRGPGSASRDQPILQLRVPQTRSLRRPGISAHHMGGHRYVPGVWLGACTC